jgi:heme oxygenase
MTVHDPASAAPTRVSLRMVLRGATAADHETVDSAFGFFDLAVPSSYTALLLAHASVLGPLEKAVAGLWSSWRPRLPFLASDLADLGHQVPAGDPLDPADDAQRWGMLYVLEGSRLGGGILAGRVGPGLPNRYLSAVHEGGSWRLFGDALEHSAAGQSDTWIQAAVAGAKLAFARFAHAAANAQS